MIVIAGCADAHGSWEEAFHAGELAGSLPLHDVVVQADHWPGPHQGAFYDGYAHVVSPAEPLAFGVQVEVTVPEGHRRTVHDGVVRGIVTDEPSRARGLSVAEAYGKAFDVDVANGLRIAVQRKYGDDLGEAVRVATTYPATYHPALFEELGWRVGDEDRSLTSRLDALAAEVPEGARCDFYAGADRGYAMARGLWASEAAWERFDDRIQGDCAEERLIGLGHAVYILHGPGETADGFFAFMRPEQAEIARRARTQALGST